MEDVITDFNDLTGPEQAILIAIDRLQKVNDFDSRQALSTLPEIFSQEIEILRGYAILALDSLEIINKNILTEIKRDILNSI